MSTTTLGCSATCNAKFSASRAPDAVAKMFAVEVAQQIRHGKYAFVGRPGSSRGSAARCSLIWRWPVGS